MVSINNNLGIGALKATAKAETAGIQKDNGQVTVKEDALFPQEPTMGKADVFNSKNAFEEALRNGKTTIADGVIKCTGDIYLKPVIIDGKLDYERMSYHDAMKFIHG